MHFKTSCIADWPISGPEDFEAEWKSVKRLQPGEFELDLSPADLREETEVWIPAI
jgi:hypothetical protein